jgi:hypothetical protein
MVFFCLNISMALIDELYDSSDCEKIKMLYSADPSSRDSIMQAIGYKIVESERILLSNPLDILSLICCTAPFANDKEECQQVAIIIHRGLTYENPLPYIMDDFGFKLAEKTLTSLSFFRKAMEKRTKHQGAPSPEFYRSASILLFKKNDLPSIAAHHINWENFLNEMFL